MVKVERVTEKDYNLCIGCHKIHNRFYMFKVENSYVHENHTYYNKIIYCKDCLFRLLLELNSLFEVDSLLDGTDIAVKNKVVSKMGIPNEVYHALENGRRIEGIKNLRYYYGTRINEAGEEQYVMDLREAKEQVDTWCEILYGKDYLQTQFHYGRPKNVYRK
jgi:hypothetical protein